MHIAKLTRAFTPSVLHEQTNRVTSALDPPETGGTRQLVRTTAQQRIVRPTGRFVGRTRTSLNGAPNRHRDTPSSSSPSVGDVSASGRDGILSSTARESAVIAEWEPILELQRNIEEGGFGRSYGYSSEGERVRGDHDWAEETDGIEVVNGVFCGYRFTKEECLRLRSANPSDFSMWSVR